MKIIEGYDKYTISISGKVYKGSKPVAICIKDGKYKTFSVFNGMGRKMLYLHKEIARAYIPNPMGYTQVNHKDGNKQNNSIDNLEWCSPSQNTKHAIENGLFDPMIGLKAAWKKRGIYK